MHGYFRTSNWHQTPSVWHSHSLHCDLCNKIGIKELKLLSWCTLMFLLIESVQQQCSFSPCHGFHLLYSSKLYTVYNVAAASEGWMIIVVDMMNRTAEHWLALSSYKLKWLWWMGKVLVEAQGNLNPSPVSFSLLHKCNTVTVQHALLSFITYSPLPPHPLSLISSFHKSLSATFSFCALLFFFSPLHFITQAWSGLIISVEPWFTLL